MTAKLILKKGREKSLLRRHPWIFSGGIEKLDGKAASGESVIICNAEGEALAVGAWSPDSKISCRIWDFNPETKIDADFFRARFKQALALRGELALDRSQGCRLINSENDFLPGLICDRYGDFLSVQILSAGTEFHRETILDLLEELLAPKGIFERSDVFARELEGLTQQAQLVRGEQPETFVMEEGELKLLIDIPGGHKTGFYLDQRDNRAAVKAASAGRRVLNCFCYTGAFSLAALKGGASEVISVDGSEPALETLDKQLELNELDASKHTSLKADVFKLLRTYRDSRETFDMIILDPPKFADTKGQVKGALRGYKDINLLAMKLLNPGGLLFTYSCSGLVSPVEFEDCLRYAIKDSGRQGQVIQRLHQSADHPTSLAFSEGEYLKGFCIAVH